MIWLGVRHSYHWHNQRFYYNYENKKLEFIAYDCYAGIDEELKMLFMDSPIQIQSAYRQVISTNNFLITLNS